MLVTIARRGLPIGLVLLSGLLAWLAWVLAQAVSDEAGVSSRPASAFELWRGKAIARHMLFPGLRAGQGVPDLHLGARDLELGLNYLLTRARLGQARVGFVDDGVRIDASVLLPEGAPGRFLNAGIVLRPRGDGLALAHLVLGRTELPAPVSRLLFGLLLKFAPGAIELSQLDRVLAGMHLIGNAGDGRLVWRGARIQPVLDGVRMRLLGLDEARMRPYRLALAGLAQRRPQPGFAEILGDLFELARQRSRGADPVRENRALLLTLAEQVNGLSRDPRPSPEAAPLRGLRLAGRGDFVEHLTLSAALAVVAGGQMANAAGLLKEMGDSELGGSGFSFTDLAVDRAGARLGRMAVESAASARRLQALLAGSDQEALFLPQVRDLPEFIPAGQFQRRFGGVNGAGYKTLLREIDRRIDALPLYRDDVH